APAPARRGGRGGRHLPDLPAAVVRRTACLHRRRRGERTALLRQLPLPGRVRRLLRGGHRQESLPALLVAVDRGAVLRVLPGAAGPAVPDQVPAPACGDPGGTRAAAGPLPG